MFCLLVSIRRYYYVATAGKRQPLSVPVIIVGNITVGGTGKTPLVIWLIEQLKQRGYIPGIISRGYGGSSSEWPMDVVPNSNPEDVGDEPVLIASSTQSPMIVDPDRLRAANYLIEKHACNVIVSDDGLQHYRLPRDIEIAVVDGERRFGNGYCLPAGPLREPQKRLAEVDFVVSNSGNSKPNPNLNEVAMRIYIAEAVNLQDPSVRRALTSFDEEPVHAIAGIGHPARFFSMLQAYGLRLHEHAFADHQVYRSGDLEFNDKIPVLMTEKDAVKCRRFAQTHHWYVPLEVAFEPIFSEQLFNLLGKSRHG